MRFKLVLFAALFWAMMSTQVLSQTKLWSQLAEQDLDAAYTLIRENHPAALPEVGDENFQKNLAEGYLAAKKIAQEADDYRDYRASLLRFASSFDDIHIWTNPYLYSDFAWPGFLVSLVDGQWRVLPHQGKDLPPVGAELLSCDGQTPDQIAANQLVPYTIGWNVPAHRKLRSVRLLVDRGESPFQRFKSCTFRAPDGSKVEHAMTWQNFSAQDYNEIATAARPRAGNDLGLNPWREGWWIRVGTLNDDAKPIVERVVDNRMEITNAPFVVLDLRGNVGGSSYYSRRIAEALYGTDAVEAVGHSETKGGTATWRVSPGNLQTLDGYVVRFTKQLGADSALVKYLSGQRDAMALALSSGKTLSSAQEADSKEKANERLSRPKKVPHVYLLTDNSCFSSCLLATKLFRQLGATHIGQETSAATRYTEVREIDLPSGLSTFSTMQSYSPGQPIALGPFVPSILIGDREIASDDDVRAALAKIIDRGT